MPKLIGGDPGTWHAGLVPGASAPFRVQFDASREADIDDETAAYLRSTPGPYVVGDDVDEPQTAQEKEAKQEAQPPDATKSTKPKARRQAALD